jgi:hypothetical protein
MSFELKKIKGGRISMNKKTFLFMFLAVGVAVIFSTGAASAANTNNNTTAVNITTNHVTISGFNNIGTIFKVTSNINSNNAKDSIGGIFSRGTVNQQTVSYISGNTANNGSGGICGGIYNSGSLMLTNCYNTGTITSVTSMLGAPFTPIVYQNKAPGNGAGVTNGPLQTVSYISGNTAKGNGGGIFKLGAVNLRMMEEYTIKILALLTYGQQKVSVRAVRAINYENCILTDNSANGQTYIIGGSGDYAEYTVTGANPYAALIQ